VFTIAAPRIEVTPSPLDFGPVAAGGEATLVLTIDNTGTAPLDVTATSVQTPAFAIGRSAFSIAPGGSDTLGVSFSPSAIQSYVDTLDISHNATGSPQRVPLSGSGIGTPMLSLTAPDGGETWQYDTWQRIEWQSSLVDSIKVEYRSSAGGSWITIAASVPSDSTGLWWQIPDAESEEARVRVSEVGGSAADSSAALFEITVPRLAASPRYANLGLVTIGQSLPFKITLGNIGSAALDLPSIISDNADFTPGASSMTIGFNAWDSLMVTFSPQTVGPDTAKITIVTNGPGSPVEIVLTGEGTNTVDASPMRPTAFALGQNHPNPFTGRTTIRYALPVRAPVVLDVYDLQGHRVATLVDGTQEPGNYTVPFGPGVSTADGRLRDVRAGVYFYRLRAGSFVATRKMLFLR
jgi:hypothetical protein